MEEEREQPAPVAVRSYAVVGMGVFHVIMSGFCVTLAMLDVFDRATGFAYIGMSSGLAYFVCGFLAVHVGFDVVNRQAAAVCSSCFCLVGIFLSLLSLNSDDFKAIVAGNDVPTQHVALAALLLVEGLVSLTACVTCCCYICCCWPFRTIFPKWIRKRVGAREDRTIIADGGYVRLRQEDEKSQESSS